MARFKLIEDLEKTLYIFSLSDIHKKWTIADIQRLVIPPLKLNQYRIYEDKITPLCFASWAFLDAETAEGYAHNKRKIQPEDWNKGKVVWLVDVVAPYGGSINALLRLDNERKEASKGQKGLGDGGGIAQGKDFRNIFYRRSLKKYSGARVSKRT